MILSAILLLKRTFAAFCFVETNKETIYLLSDFLEKNYASNKASST